MSAPLPVVLVHGAWHGAWCFAAVQQALNDLGVPSYAIDLPGHGASILPLADLYGDADYVAAVLRHLGTPVVLVGHSYGGAVITEAAVHHPDIAHLVYLTAFALDKGESVMSLITSLPPVETLLLEALIPADEGTTVVDPGKAAAALYGECSPAVIATSIARLSPQRMGAFVDTVTGSPRDVIPSTYVRCTLDRTIHIDHQDTMAARCDTIHTLDTDHSPFASRVAETAAILHKLAAS